MESPREVDLHRLTRYLSGDCGPDEAEEIQAWIAENEECAVLMDKLKRIWDTTETSFMQCDVDAAWRAVSEKLSQDRTYTVELESGQTQAVLSRDGGETAKKRGGNLACCRSVAGSPPSVLHGREGKTSYCALCRSSCDSIDNQLCKARQEIPNERRATSDQSSEGTR